MDRGCRLEGILKGIPKIDEPILFTAVELGAYSVPSNLVQQYAEKYFTVQKLFLDHSFQVLHTVNNFF